MRVQKLFFISKHCDGCQACEVACLEKHSQSQSIFMTKMEQPSPQPRIKVKRSGNQYWATVCQHCNEAMCVGTCMTGALQYSATGEVFHNAKQCVGCWMCIMACPFGAIATLNEAKKASKCDLCKGEKTPPCVASCSRQALLYGTPEDYEMKVAGD
ncbi:4Fe-4S dicluster domain-containing protein [Desulfosporosinus sp. BICA1-9]|uniref:4Fe-4S dicluster domain-containing protein n=1 Tax=Desulfosporosinus sp. BICA1-9 TaxID=1531958 RepID=UPI00061F6299|nr:4Fe-4S dicluster domain-containing protein [Desulfosporosinus sp. BICA1-9]KJS49395.1 MAG: hydrogenase [Peptococcaceae bacterium BRH_c23]